MANSVQEILIGVPPSVILDDEKRQTALKLLAILATPLRHHLSGPENHFDDEAGQTDQSVGIDISEVKPKATPASDGRIILGRSGSTVE